MGVNVVVRSAHSECRKQRSANAVDLRESQGCFEQKGWLAAMKFQCIKCLVTWGEGDPEVEGYSHGLCLTCLKETLVPTVRRKQLREGNFDCFGRSGCYCDQHTCKYREVCLWQAAQ